SLASLHLLCGIPAAYGSARSPFICYLHTAFLETIQELPHYLIPARHASMKYFLSTRDSRHVKTLLVNINPHMHLFLTC
ncbi:MAG: hypothetical protein ACE5OP_13935, partial [Candidatus Glassbacteria bacterium]